SYELDQGPVVKRMGSDVADITSNEEDIFTYEVVNSDNLAADWNERPKDVSRDVVRLNFTNSFSILWDGLKMFKIVAPENKRDSFCGLCGNFDGNRENDMVIGPNSSNGSQLNCDNKKSNLPRNSQTSDVDEWANSWFSEISGSTECNEECGLA
ncbi:hypothetical protein CAPTEDRAFT_189616, partial [Capitella teleta]